ncbi:carbohydrate-binding protein [Archangium violaceum]|uniref:TIM-barrel domain-containing protein n=1 Tax=Archangium violaceum TaxID=83451 RepID=UPI002B2E6210|nr:carbohydrate-binding protein [Archangium violaceum]
MFASHRRRARLLATTLLSSVVGVGLSALPAHAALGSVTSASLSGDTLTLTVGGDKLLVQALRPDIVKVDYRPGGVADPPTAVIDPAKTWATGNITSADMASNPIVVTTAQLTVKISRNPARLSVFDATGALVLSEQAAEGVYADGVKFNHGSGQAFYGITGNPVPWAEKDPKQNLAEGMQRNDGGRVNANMQGDGGAPLAFTHRYGLLVDSIDGDFAITDTTLEFSGVSTRNVAYYVLVGPPRQVMAGVAEISGKPALSPKWALGFNNSEWGTTQTEVTSIVQGYRDRKIPLDAFTLDFDFKAWGEDDYGEFRWNSTSASGNVHPNKFPSGAAGTFARDMAARGVMLMGIMKPRVIVGKAGGGTTAQGQWARTNNCFYPGLADYNEYFSGRPANDVDFSKQTCRDWYWQHSRTLFDAGIAGWWNDEADEANGTLFNSLQHFNMQRSLYEGQRAVSDRRVFSLNRNFYLGAQRYGYGMWSGDIESGFGNMADQRTRMLTSINIGESKWGMDIGGFFGDPSSENYARWMQFGAFVPIYRVHAVDGKQRQPWVYGATAESAAKGAIELRSRLMPYLYAHERINHETGIGLVRPLFYDYPTDPNAANLTSEWMFGESLLVAPVVEQGAASKQVYLPAGTWIDYTRGSVYTGPLTFNYPVNASTWQDIPLFVKAGAILPTQEVLQYVSEKPVKQIDLDVFPTTARSEFTLYDDDGLTRAYENGVFFKQRITAQRTSTSVTVETQAKTGSFSPALTHYIVKVNATTGTAARINGTAPTRYGDLAALKAATGEGWTTGVDVYGPYTAVRIAAGVARTVVVDGTPSTPPPPPVTSVLEAEDAALSSGAIVQNDHPGYSGRGFVAGYWNSGATTTFTLQASTAGTYSATLKYSNGNGSARTVSMVLNGVRTQLTLPATADWNTWSTYTARIPLNAGTHTLAYVYDSGDSGHVNLDSLTIAPPPPPMLVLEAEDAALSSGAIVQNDHPGYSGRGFVAGYWNSGAATTFTLQASTAGTYSATLKYSNGNGSARTVSMVLNGVRTQLTLPATADWNTWSIYTARIPLNASTNTLAYVYGSGDSAHVNLDSLTIAP